MSHHPLQATAFPSDAEAHFFVLASGNRLSVVSTESDELRMAITATAQDHQGLIRLVACHGTRYIVSTGEDKMLNVYEYQAKTAPSEEDQDEEKEQQVTASTMEEASAPKGKLELRSSRELVKRANAMQVTEKAEIVVGDKFGDVYVYPLLAHPVDPTATTTTTTDRTNPKTPKAQPILGHVSMLNALVHVPAAPEYGLPHDLIVTGDRDEHVRVSRYPQGHIIDKFLWGSEKFVTALLYIPATLAFPTPLIISGGGDSTLQVWNLASGKLLNRFGIQDSLEKYIVVGPELPTPVPAGRRKDKAQGGGRKKKGKQVEQDEGQVEAEEDVLVVNEDEQIEVAEETEQTEAAQTGGVQLPTGLGVTHLEFVGGHSHRAGPGVIVAAAGCTALLYIPLELLLCQPTQRTTQIVDYSHPVLALCGRPNEDEHALSSAKTDFHVTIDLSRPKKSESSTLEGEDAEEETERCALQQASYELVPDQPEGSFSGEMELIWDQALVRIAREAALPTTTKDRAPDVSSLYPVLSLLHHPDTNFEVLAAAGGKNMEAEGETNGKSVSVWKSVARGWGQKRGADAEGDAAERDAEEGDAFRKRKGKRAAGRAEIQRRLELEQERLKNLQTGAEGDNKAMEE
ncbi:BZ3500_MvSof-1268-A1-R1_Chr2-3g05224 [Microbotryum saponariae]|uniref:BZ3500_MvSof-1268-A1-R1_Chr2-3g05224 protein n=1 Tax=Microbotryum saponariae TaxID=289078 RepID=A0A2X0L7T0_9BASI|nr:BZ3500_MvSof-1268-A1-R1_Chr2-3g05224 [Microbotryum saponariae]SDA01050.1 BZ3501_MvSof-1269-A2-R1_Chr2-2g04897 [Microbotryum saponariae]